MPPFYVVTWCITCEGDTDISLLGCAATEEVARELLRPQLLSVLAEHAEGFEEDSCENGKKSMQTEAFLEQHGFWINPATNELTLAADAPIDKLLEWTLLNEDVVYNESCFRIAYSIEPCDHIVKTLSVKEQKCTVWRDREQKAAGANFKGKKRTREDDDDDEQKEEGSKEQALIIQRISFLKAVHVLKDILSEYDEDAYKADFDEIETANEMERV